MFIKKRKLGQKGDTIVEVLIAMSVVSAVLGGAYSLVNKTTKNAQQAQEHSQALKVAEGQLELLKSYVGDLQTITGGKQFCFQDTDRKLVQINSSTPPDQAAPIPTSAAGYSDGCQFDDNGVSNRYRVAFTKDTATNTYKVHITWDGITGSLDSVELAYKV